MNTTARHSFSQSVRGFSLVEVVLALGLVSFCLLSVVGLLPVGLKAVRNAHEESAAANALSQLSEALRDATTTNAGLSYSAAGVFSNITWSSGTGATNNMTLLLSGQPATNQTSSARLVARIEVQPPPADGVTPVRARVSVAWPAAAAWSNNSWSKSDGVVKGGIQFLPQK